MSCNPRPPPPPTTEIKTNCLESVETERLEPPQTNSAVAGGRVGLGFGLSFPGRFCDFHFSPSCLLQDGFWGDPSGQNLITLPAPSHPPAHPRNLNTTGSLGKPNGNSPVPLLAPQRDFQPPGPGRAGSVRCRQHQLHTGMVCPALHPLPVWGDDDTGTRGRVPVGRCRAWRARAVCGLLSAARPTGVGWVLPAAPC